MPKRNVEVTGHDLLSQQQQAAEEYLSTLAKLQLVAEERHQVIESRLKDLETEKLVLNQLVSVDTDVATPIEVDTTQLPPF